MLRHAHVENLIICAWVEVLMGYHKIGAVDRVFLMISVCTFDKIFKKELILSTKKNIHKLPNNES